MQRKPLLVALEQEANRKHLVGLLDLAWRARLGALCVGGQLKSDLRIAQVNLKLDRKFLMLVLAHVQLVAFDADKTRRKRKTRGQNEAGQEVVV